METRPVETGYFRQEQNFGFCARSVYGKKAYLCIGIKTYDNDEYGSEPTVGTRDMARLGAGNRLLHGYYGA